MLENEKIWILQNILSNVEEHNSAKLLRESLFKIIDGLTPLITASGAGIYTSSITPASTVPVEGDKVFLVTQPGTYTNFGNVILPANHFGFIFKNGNNFSIQSVEMPTIPISGKVEEGNTEAVSGGEVFENFSIEKKGAYIDVYDNSTYMDKWSFSSTTLKPVRSNSSFALSNWISNVSGKTIKIRRSDGGLISKSVVGYETKESDGVRISESVDDRVTELIIEVPENINHILLYIKYEYKSLDFSNDLLIVEEYDADAISIKMIGKSVSDREIIENKKNKIQEYAGYIEIDEGIDIYETEGEQINKTLKSATDWSIDSSPQFDLSAFIPLVEGRKYIVRRKDGGDMKPSMVTYDKNHSPLRRLFSNEEYPNATTFVKEAIFTADKDEAFLVVYTRYQNKLNPTNINDLVEVIEYGGNTDATINVSGTSIKISEIISFQSEKIKSFLTNNETNETYGDAQAKDRFVLEMNNKAEQIGMFNTHFDEPAGFPTTLNQLMSGEDAMRMVIYASDFRLINDIWNKKTKDLTIYGANARTIPISTTVKNSTLENDCYILGGKTGSIGVQTNTLVMIVKSKHTGIVYAVGELNTALNNSKNKFVNVGKVINQIEGRITDAEIDKGSMCVTKLPEFKASMYSRYPYDLEFDYMRSSQFTPASITKVMSAILLCQYENDLSKRITLNQSDITSGTGPSFQAGDIITLEDLLYAMMLPSSNTATHAVARYVGNVLLKSDNNVL